MIQIVVSTVYCTNKSANAFSVRRIDIVK